MNKRLLLCLTPALVGLLALPVSALPLMTPDGFLYDLDLTNKTARLAALTSAFNQTELVIPATVTSSDVEYAVTEISTAACQNKTEVTSITIGENVVTIADNAFYGCSAVTSVTLPEALRTIGQMAFYGDKSLKDVVLPEGVESIGNFAFYNCTSIKTVNVPASVTTLGGNPWGGCTSLTALSVAEGSENFTAVDDVLFDKDVTRLIAAPCMSNYY